MDLALGNERLAIMPVGRDMESLKVYPIDAVEIIGNLSQVLSWNSENGKTLRAVAVKMGDLRRMASKQGSRGEREQGRGGAGEKAGFSCSPLPRSPALFLTLPPWPAIGLRCPPARRLPFRGGA